MYGAMILAEISLRVSDELWKEGSWGSGSYRLCGMLSSLWLSDWVGAYGLNIALRYPKDMEIGMLNLVLQFKGFPGPRNKSDMG